jgi:uncharacterized protein YegP (UPF0339 family)
MNVKFEIYMDRVAQYRWRLIAGNGEIVATSEGYTTEYSARRSAERVRTLAVTARIV